MKLKLLIPEFFVGSMLNSDPSQKKMISNMKLKLLIPEFFIEFSREQEREMEWVRERKNESENVSEQKRGW